MAHDGSYEVKWKGIAFPHLMHHPNNSFHKTENYGSARAGAGGYGGHSEPAHGHSSGHGGGHGHGPAAEADGESVFTPGTGTWNGAAPRGYLGGGKALHASEQSAGAAAPAATTVAIQEPDYMRLPSGAAMPLVAFSTQQVTSPDAIRSALEAGCRHFDCAESYGNEAVVGQGLAELAASGRRAELFVSSKAWNTHHRPADLRSACERSLSALGLEYLDLYLLHWPEAWSSEPAEGASPTADADATMQETWQAMEKLVDDGLVRQIGVCNFSLKQIEELLGSCRIKPVVNQMESHPLLSQRKLVGVCYRKGVQCVGTCVLGSDSSLLEDALVKKVAAETGKTAEQILLKYNLQRGVPVVVNKAAIDSSLLAGVHSWRLTNDLKVLLDTLDNGKRFVTPAWKTWADPEEGGITKPSLVL